MDLEDEKADTAPHLPCHFFFFFSFFEWQVLEGLYANAKSITYPAIYFLHLKNNYIYNAPAQLQQPPQHQLRQVGVLS